MARQDENSPSGAVSSDSPRPTRISVDLAPEELVKIAREYQLKASDARQEATNLRRKLADRTNEDSDSEDESSNSNKRLRSSGANEEDEERRNEELKREKEIKDLAKEFVIMKGLWLHGGEKIFHTNLDDDFSPLPHHRFANTKSKAQGQLAELRELIPSQYHEKKIFQGHWLPKTFSQAMQVQRSNTSTRVRKHTGASIFDYSDSDLEDAQRRSGLFRDRIGYVGEGKYDPLQVEVIHKDYDGKFDLGKAFLNPILMRVFVSIIRGKSGLSAFKSGSKISIGSNMGKVLGLTHITPGAIAACCVLARWALSKDEQLQERGASNINWADDFDVYLRILMEGLEQRKKPVLEVFRTWDEAIFPSTSDQGLASKAKQGEDSNTTMADALEMLRAAEVEEEEEDESARQQSQTRDGNRSGEDERREASSQRETHSSGKKKNVNVDEDL